MPAEPYFVLRIATQDPDIKTPSNPKIIPELTTADVWGLLKFKQSWGRLDVTPSI